MTIATTRKPTDPEDPLEIPLAPMIEWFRVDASRRIALFLAIGGVAMSIGMLSVAGFVLGRGPAALAWGGFGILVVIGAGVSTIAGTMRVLWEESYLALRVDGILWVHGARRRLVRWEEVDDVRHDAARDAVVIVRGGDEWIVAERFAGIASADLAKRIAAVRRRVLFGLVSVG